MIKSNKPIRGMKSLIFLLIACFLFVGCNTKIVEETIEKYPDGSPKVVRFFKDNGKTKELFKECFYYPNQQKYMEGEYKNAKRDGVWMSWHQNGNTWSEGNFKDGLDHGNRIIYHENGKKYIEGEYTNGVKTGTWKFYDQNGNFVKEEKF